MELRVGQITVIKCLISCRGLSGRPPGGAARLLRADQHHFLGPGLLILRQPQLLVGEDESPVRALVETKRVVTWPGAKDAGRSAALGFCRTGIRFGP